jgi:hypothetical protein
MAVVGTLGVCYAVMCNHGGIYTDADTLCVRPMQVRREVFVLEIATVIMLSAERVWGTVGAGRCVLQESHEFGTQRTQP